MASLQTLCHKFILHCGLRLGIHSSLFGRFTAYLLLFGMETVGERNFICHKGSLCLDVDRFVYNS